MNGPNLNYPAPELQSLFGGMASSMGVMQPNIMHVHLARQLVQLQQQQQRSDEAAVLSARATSTNVATSNRNGNRRASSSSTAAAAAAAMAMQSIPKGKHAGKAAGVTVCADAEESPGRVVLISPESKVDAGSTVTCVLNLSAEAHQLFSSENATIELEYLAFQGTKSSSTWKKAHAQKAFIVQEIPSVTCLKFTVDPDMPSATTRLRVTYQSTANPNKVILKEQPYEFNGTTRGPSVGMKRSLEHGSTASVRVRGGRASLDEDYTTRHTKKKLGEPSATGQAAEGSGNDNANIPYKTHSTDERHFLEKKVLPNAIKPIVATKHIPNPSEVVRRIVDRVDKGKFCTTQGGQITFQDHECVLVKGKGENRSGIRMDIVNYVSKCMPHALVFKLFRDPDFDPKDWQQLERVSGCFFGYGGAELGGWTHNTYMCCNPMHYRFRGKDVPEINNVPIRTKAAKRARREKPTKYSSSGTSPSSGAITSSSSSEDIDPASRPNVGVGSDYEMAWLVRKHHPASLLGLDIFRKRPDAHDVIRRLTDKIAYGMMTKMTGRDVNFEKKKCLLVACTRENRSAVRMDIVNFTSKCWPHALAYKLWRDPLFQLKRWQTLVSTGDCKYGYAGKKCTTGQGWVDPNFICVNPWHYHVAVEERSDSNKPREATKASTKKQAQGQTKDLLQSHSEELPFANVLPSLYDGSTGNALLKRLDGLEGVGSEANTTATAAPLEEELKAIVDEPALVNGVMSFHKAGSTLKLKFAAPNAMHVVVSGKIMFSRSPTEEAADAPNRTITIGANLAYGDVAGEMGGVRGTMVIAAVDDTVLVTFSQESCRTMFADHYDAYENLMEITQSTTLQVKRQLGSLDSAIVMQVEHNSWSQPAKQQSCNTQQQSCKLLANDAPEALTGSSFGF